MAAKRISKTAKALISTLRIVMADSAYDQSFIAGFRNAVTAALMSEGWDFDDARAYIDEQLAN